MGTHEPQLTSTSRWGVIAWCRCGWRSAAAYTAVQGAMVAFGRHLLAVARG